MQIPRRTLLSVVIFSFLFISALQAEPSLNVSVGFSWEDAPEEQKERGKVDVAKILNSVEPQITYESIITKNEWTELECDYALELLDRTQTAFGPWGLRRLLWPVDDRCEIQRRQDIVRMLVEDEALFGELSHVLQNIKEAERELLSYWDPIDGLNVLAKELYYSLPFKKISGSLQDTLNNSRVALESGMLAEFGRLTASFVMALGLKGFMFSELLDFGSANEQEKPSFFESIKKGLAAPIRVNTFTRDLYPSETKRSLAYYYGYGTAGDYYAAFKEKMQKNAVEDGLPKWASDNVIPPLVFAGVGVTKSIVGGVASVVKNTVFSLAFPAVSLTQKVIL